MTIVITDPKNPSNPYLDRITLVQGDIAQQDTDAIVALLPQNLEYKGEINDAILKAAGQKLDEFVLEHIYQPKIGDLYAVPGFNLRCRNIFFCIMPNWRTEFDRQEKYLLHACRRAIETAQNMGLSSVAFPPLACGKEGFPEARGARLIIRAIEERLDKTLKEVRLTCLTPETLAVFRERLAAIGWIG